MTLSASALGKSKASESNTPVLFAGHGSPMNAIELNEFSKRQIELGKDLIHPKVILMISAHWETRGTQIQISKKPEIIHDFRGFPKELQEFKYNVSGAPDIAIKAFQKLPHAKIQTTTDWGLDHGGWSVLARLFPKGDVPVFQMSLNQNFTLAQHLELASQLKSLRKLGVMIIGSGNVVHNLRMTDETPNVAPFDWALEFDDWILKKIKNHDLLGIVKFEGIKSDVVKMAVPTMEHYLPLIYSLGATNSIENKKFPIVGFQERSISMRSVLIDK
jgi:4,5-DOPA dioxygenase extradiol